MRMARSWQRYLFLFLLSLLSACAPVISPELRARVDPSLTFREVLQNPTAYKGKNVVLGGEIIQILPQRDGMTLIEVLQWPLDRGDEPKRTLTFQGKFLVLVSGNLDLSLYQKGKKITVAGEIQGETKGKEIEQLTEKDYDYPLLASKQLHAWRDYLYPYSTPPPPDLPWWDNPTERWLRF